MTTEDSIRPTRIKDTGGFRSLTSRADFSAQPAGPGQHDPRSLYAGVERRLRLQADGASVLRFVIMGPP
jgi:hypothetical protein